MRRAGHCYADIGEALGITEEHAYRVVADELTRLREDLPEDIEAVRALEIQRLNFMLSRLEPRILDGDTLAIKTALLIMERRAAYQGLDQPELVDHRLAVLDARVLTEAQAAALPLPPALLSRLPAPAPQADRPAEALPLPAAESEQPEAASGPPEVPKLERRQRKKRETTTAAEDPKTDPELAALLKELNA